MRMHTRWWKTIILRGQPFNEDELFSAILIMGILILCAAYLAYEYFR